TTVSFPAQSGRTPVATIYLTCINWQLPTGQRRQSELIRRMQKRINVSPEATRCSTCMMSDSCLPLGMQRSDVARLDELINERIRLPKGSALFHLGDKTEAVYGIRSGSIKTQLEDASGQVQITGFLLPGEILGMDGLVNNTHVSHAI